MRGPPFLSSPLSGFGANRWKRDETAHQLSESSRSKTAFEVSAWAPNTSSRDGERRHGHLLLLYPYYIIIIIIMMIIIIDHYYGYYYHYSYYYYHYCVYIYIYIYIHTYIWGGGLPPHRGSSEFRQTQDLPFAFMVLHPVSITRFPLRRFSPGAGLLRNPFFTLSTLIFSRGWVRKDGNLLTETGCMEEDVVTVKLL